MRMNVDFPAPRCFVWMTPRLCEPLAVAFPGEAVDDSLKAGGVPARVEIAFRSVSGLGNVTGAGDEIKRDLAAAHSPRLRHPPTFRTVIWPAARSDRNGTLAVSAQSRTVGGLLRRSILPCRRSMEFAILNDYRWMSGLLVTVRRRSPAFFSVVFCGRPFQPRFSEKQLAPTHHLGAGLSVDHVIAKIGSLPYQNSRVCHSYWASLRTQGLRCRSSLFSGRSDN